MPDEFELIAHILFELGDQQGLVLGPGDDCAVIELDSDQQLASSIDTFSAGQHFPQQADPWLIAQRCLRGALSDLAAMGAAPRFSLVSLSMPSADREWLGRFARGMGDAAREFGCAIAGGNLSNAGLSVSISVHGTVPKGHALTRAGAKPEQAVYVSGLLGGAAKALEQVSPALDRSALRALTKGEWQHPLNRYWLPEPRLSLGQGLIGLASAAIDLSDGLYADARHLSEASCVGLKLESALVPRIGTLHESDDYELLFTAPVASAEDIEALAARLGVSVTRIGITTADKGLWVNDIRIEKNDLGYRHF